MIDMFDTDIKGSYDFLIFVLLLVSWVLFATSVAYMLYEYFKFNVLRYHKYGIRCVVSLVVASIMTWLFLFSFDPGEAIKDHEDPYKQTIIIDETDIEVEVVTRSGDRYLEEINKPIDVNEYINEQKKEVIK